MCYEMTSSWWKYLMLLVVCAEITDGLITEAQILASQKLIRRSCKSRVQITNDDELDDILQGRWDNISRSVKCYLNCCLSMMKVIKRDGHMDYETVIKQAANLLPERRAATENTINNCKDAGADLTDKCEIGYEICKCFYSDNPKNYFIP